MSLATFQSSMLHLRHIPEFDYNSTKKSLYSNFATAFAFFSAEYGFVSSQNASQAKGRDGGNVEHALQSTNRKDIWQLGSDVPPLD